MVQSRFVASRFVLLTLVAFGHLAAWPRLVRAEESSAESSVAPRYAFPAGLRAYYSVLLTAGTGDSALRVDGLIGLHDAGKRGAVGADESGQTVLASFSVVGGEVGGKPSAPGTLGRIGHVEFARLRVDATGQTLATEKTTFASLLLAPWETLIVEPLVSPSTNQRATRRRWRYLKAYDAQSDTTPLGRLLHRDRGEAADAEAIGEIEDLVESRQTADDGRQVKIETRRVATVKTKTGAKPLQSLDGRGAFVFDRATGLLASADFTGVHVTVVQSERIETPVAYKLSRILEDATRDQAKSADAAAPATPTPKVSEEFSQSLAMLANPNASEDEVALGLRSLAREPYDPDASDAAIQAISSHCRTGDEPAAPDALLALARWDSLSCVGDVVDLVDHPRAATRHAAFSYLATMRVSRGLKAVASRLSVVEDRVAASHALRFADSAAEPILVKQALRDDRIDPAVRVIACEILADLGPAVAPQTLATLRAVARESGETGQAAATALKRLGSPLVSDPFAPATP